VRSPAALVVLLVAAGCSATKRPLTVDDLDKDVPHRSLEEACAALPPPSGDASFVFAADIRDERSNAEGGTLQVAVETGTFHDQPAWFVEETWNESDHGLPKGARQAKHARTWLARDLKLLSAVVDVDTSRGDGTTERLHSELGPTERGYWISLTRSDGTSSREESSAAGPLWARTFAGAMVFLRLCPAESALYAGKHGDSMTVRTNADGTMTLAGFASMSATVRVSDRAVLSLHEHVWELSPRRFDVRGTPR